jgi:PAS domain S-box-containing protein
MAAGLRLLHLEDNSMDAELVAAALAADGLVCELVRAESRETFARALDDGPYDLILSDYALPGFDGVTAQAMARVRWPEVPFLFISGTMGEEVAIDCLKNGATDYVLKHRLARLAPAVRRALLEAQSRIDRDAAEAEVRRLNDALRVALGQANSFLDSIFENLPDVVFVKDARDLRFIRLNRASDDALGIDRSQLIGKSLHEVFPPALAEKLELADHEAIRSRAVVQIAEEVMPTRHRGPRVFTTKKIPIFENGEPRYVMGISQDITERRVAEEDARLSRLEAERANRAKSDFLSRMSHDLRTPMNAVLGFAQVLDLDGLPPEQAESVRHILIGGRHLLDLINEVLDISRIEAGQLSLSPEPVSVAEVIQHVVDLIRPLAAARGITLSVNLGAFGGKHVRADRQRVRQILLNFLGNAVKYNRDHGTVVITATETKGPRIRIGVADSGPGIAEEKLALLFQPFERLGAELSSVEGTGLGLAVAKGLAEAMRGAVGVSSTVGRGSTFWVELPETDAPDVTAVTAEAGARTEHAAGDTHGTILYIEDNSSNVRLLQRLLGRRSGVTLLTATRGEDGIAMAITERPDLVLLDLHLPDLSGEDVLHRLWADPRTRSLPVAVLSADALSAQRQRLLASGAVAYLTKPIDVQQLLRLIDERLQPAESGAPRHE